MIFLNNTKNQTKIKKGKAKKINKDKGITLIALVITIIVLLILAGVTIATLTGQNGILTNATKSKEETQKKNLKEQVELEVQGQYKSADLSIDMDNLKKEIEDHVKAAVTKNADGSLTVEKDGYTVKVKKDGKVSEVITPPSTPDTTPYVPDGFEIKEGTNLDNGLTITNGINSYVWVEVPKSIYTIAESETDYLNIETDMKTYTADYKDSTYKDEYYSDETTGLTQEEYNNLKHAMLTSVYKNGGFWISQYEVGTETLRTSRTDPLTTPVSKEGVYPYNYVTCVQAQELAEQMNPDSSKYKSSLLFGVQWDLTCKFLETKASNLGATAEERKNTIKSDSTIWGNYNNATFNITKGKYSDNDGDSYTEVSGTYTKPSSSILLTTGTTERNSAMNIYDFAGNESEYTLEYYANTRYPCSFRGGSYYDIGAAYFSASSRHFTIGSSSDIGLRQALY
jgi:biopolymer transport protein ExbD